MRSAVRMRRDPDGVSPVISEVLMVAIVVVLAAIAYIMFAGMLSENEEEQVYVNFDPPVVNKRGAVWDAVIGIERLVPAHSTLHWVNVAIVVTSINGSVLNQTTSLRDDSTATYHDYVEFWYVDIDMGDDRINAADAIKITGMAREYEGATVKLVCANELMGTVQLTQEFP